MTTVSSELTDSKFKIGLDMLSSTMMLYYGIKSQITSWLDAIKNVWVVANLIKQKELLAYKLNPNIASNRAWREMSQFRLAYYMVPNIRY